MRFLDIAIQLTVAVKKVCAAAYLKSNKWVFESWQFSSISLFANRTIREEIWMQGEEPPTSEMAQHGAELALFGRVVCKRAKMWGVVLAT